MSQKGNNSVSATDAVTRTRRWIESVVVEYNFCPFARRELERDSIRYRVVEERDLESCLHKLIDEAVFLDDSTATETTLLIYPYAFTLFDDFLDLVALANQLLVDQGYRGVYQLASFHPDYCFADAPRDDPANYTNRAPYPTLHLLREASIEKVLQCTDNPAEIPERNIELARELGVNRLQAILAACRD